MDWPADVILSPAESLFAMGIAIQRDACKGILRDSRISKRHSGFGVHYAGVVGEICFCRIYGGKISQKIKPMGDKHKPDIQIKDGRFVEVKTSLYSGKEVEMKLEGDDELEGAEWFGLVQVVLPDTGKVYPIISNNKLKEIIRIKDYGYGKRYMCNGDEIIMAVSASSGRSGR